MLYDITPLISPRLAVWPGDTAPSRQVLMDLARGDSVTLSTLRATVHLGAHADAPSHYGAGAPTVDRCSLDAYLGPCEVRRVVLPARARLRPAQAGPPPRAERILFATGTFPDPEAWTGDFAALSPELVEWLHGHGVRLVGLDTPSVDLADSRDLPSHKACLRHGVAILEGLALGGVPEGIYELIALPLRLEGFDGSPVRAVLRSVAG